MRAGDPGEGALLARLRDAITTCQEGVDYRNRTGGVTERHVDAFEQVVMLARELVRRADLADAAWVAREGGLAHYCGGR